MLGAEELVARVAPAGSQLVGEKRMRSLWAGYGSVSQLVLEVAPAARGGWPPERLALIIKRVEAPNDEGVGHERKLRSRGDAKQIYHIERTRETRIYTGPHHFARGR